LFYTANVCREFEGGVIPITALLTSFTDLAFRAFKVDFQALPLIHITLLLTINTELERAYIKGEGF
jgi:hypothetical protein